MARITACAPIVAAVGEPDHAGPSRVTSRPTTSRAVISSAPNFGGLPAGPVGELGAGDAVGEAEVVLDPRALPGLAAGGVPLDEHGAQALRRAVDRRAQPGRAAADDDEVVEVARRRGGQPDRARRVSASVGSTQRLAVGGDHHRDVVGVAPGGRQQPLALGLVDGVPAVGHRVAGQEVADLRSDARRPAVPDEPDLVDGALADRAPGLEQRVEHRVELLLRRVPRLEQVVVDVDDVDRVGSRRRCRRRR